jgi:hypothetical protein
MATTFTWSSGGGSGDWSTSGNWTAAGYPGEFTPGADAAFLKAPAANHSYTVTYDPATLSYNNVVLAGLTLAGTGTTKTTTLQLSNGTMTVDGTINIGTQSNQEGSAILGSGVLQAGGGAFVALTTSDNLGLLNTTAAATSSGIASTVVLGDDNTAGTVLQVDPAAGSSISNTFDFSGSAGGALALNEESSTSLNYTGTIDGMNNAIASGTDSDVASVNYLNVQTPDASITSVTWTTGGDTITLMDGVTPIQSLTLGADITSGQYVDWIADSSASGQTAGETNVALGTGTDIFLSNVVCFAAGTRIATADGETSVEDLAEGDLVVTLTGADRTLAPVTWIGYRRVDLAAHPRRELVAPVRIQRGAFGDNMPHTDLVVSPDHALFVDGKLVVARLLINGMTITQDLDVRAVEYYHVELPQHAILLAEGLPAESYLDTGNRAMFSNAGLALVLHPDFAPSQGISTWADDSCAPLVTTAAEVEPIWRQLAQRAESLGYAPPSYATTTDPDLHVMVDGKRLRPLTAKDGRYMFVLPAGAKSIRLTSRAGAPAEVAAYLEDRRRLGISVDRLAFRAGAEVQEVPVDHPTLSRGWHAAERAGTALSRWTDGDAHVRVPFAPSAGPVTLEVQTTCKATYRADQAVIDQRLAA